jgi:hypothetical protein
MAIANRPDASIAADEASFRKIAILPAISALPPFIHCNSQRLLTQAGNGLIEETTVKLVIEAIERYKAEKRR